MTGGERTLRDEIADAATARGWRRRRCSGEADRYTRSGEIVTVTYRDGDDAVSHLRHVYIDGTGELRRESPNVDGEPITDPDTLRLFAALMLATAGPARAVAS